MKFIGNILWLIFGGIVTSVEYFFASIILIVSIVGIPFGIQTLKIAVFTLWPFGSEIRNKKSNSGCLSFIMNVLWIFIGGIWISLTHIAFGILLTITIVGIPFAMQHFKLASLALLPFGKEIV